MNGNRNRPVRRNKGALLVILAVLLLASVILVWWLNQEIGLPQNETLIEQNAGSGAEGTEFVDPPDIPQTSPQHNPQNPSPDAAPEAD
jgi:hypothetical protein